MESLFDAFPTVRIRKTQKLMKEVKGVNGFSDPRLFSPLHTWQQQAGRQQQQ